MIGEEKFKNGTYVLNSGCESLGAVRIQGREPIIRRRCKKGGQTETTARLLSGDRVEVVIGCDGSCNGCQPRRLASDVSSLFGN